MIIQESFKGNQEATVASEKLIAKAVNKVQEKLQTMADDSDAEYSAAMSKTNDELSKIKNNSCII